MLHRNVLVRNHVFVALLGIKKSFTQWLVKTFHMHYQPSFWKDLESPPSKVATSKINYVQPNFGFLMPDMSVFTLLSYNNDHPLVKSCLLSSHLSAFTRWLHHHQHVMYTQGYWLFNPLLRIINLAINYTWFRIRIFVNSVPPTSGVANASSWHSY